MMLCEFQKSGDSWECRSCGRRIRAFKDTPPTASCPQEVIHQDIEKHVAEIALRHGAPGVLKPEEIRPPGGPGTELKKLLAGWPLYITETPNCSCNARAGRMDYEEARQPGWCEEHLNEIVGWLREEADRRGLPFIDAAGRMLVRRAIRNARRRATG